MFKIITLFPFILIDLVTSSEITIIIIISVIAYLLLLSLLL